MDDSAIKEKMKTCSTYNEIESMLFNLFKKKKQKHNEDKVVIIMNWEGIGTEEIISKIKKIIKHLKLILYKRKCL